MFIARALAEAEELGSKEVEIESKKFLIEVKANDQGKFVKILEVRYTPWATSSASIPSLPSWSLWGVQMQTQGRGRIIFSADRASEFRSILNDLLEEYKQLPLNTEITESERLRRYARPALRQGGGSFAVFNCFSHFASVRCSLKADAATMSTCGRTSVAGL